MGGGTKHVTLSQAFRTLSSLVHESDSDSRDSFWLSSSRILHGDQSDHVSPSRGRRRSVLRSGQRAERTTFSSRARHSAMPFWDPLPVYRWLMGSKKWSGPPSRS